MKKRTAGLCLIATLLTGCSGTSTLPYRQANAANAVLGVQSESKGGDVRTFVRVRIPRRTRKRDVHPATISPLTQSVAIAVNAAAAQTFDTTPSSPGCTIGSKGTTCTFAVRAPAGTDTFTVTTYSGVDSSGSALDRGVATVAITQGKANQVAVTLGPVVSTVADRVVGSLRYAVASANAGDTIFFLLPAGSTIVLTSPITIAGNVAIAGPGESKLSISGGSSQQLFYVTGKATISGLTLTHGKATTPGQPGGTIYNAGSVTLENDVVGNSTSVVTSLRRAHGAASPFDKIAHRLHPHCTSVDTEGGAIYNRGLLVSSGTQFVGNVAESDTPSCIDGQGGAIYNDVTGSISSTGDMFDGNAAFGGGAVFNLGEGAVTFDHDTFENNKGCTAASGCPTSGCTATGCTYSATGGGAGIADVGLGVTVVNSTFVDNVAGGPTPGSIGFGAALFLASTAPTISNDTFTGNVAGGGTSSCSSGEGGAIAGASAVELDNDVFKDNVAKGDATSIGGAVFGEGGAVTGNGDTFEDNAVVASGGSCTSAALAQGGAVAGAASVTFDETAFSGNSVTAGGAGTGGAIDAINLTLDADTFTSNKAVGNGGGGAPSTVAAGGAVYVETLARLSGSTFTSNAATLEGHAQTIAAGGAVVVADGVVASSNDVFTANTITSSSGTPETVGAALAVVSGTAISTGDKFASNVAKGTGVTGGGAIYANAASQVTNVTISSNSVSGVEAVGGGIAIGPTGIINNVTLTGNSAIATGALGMGGGIYDGGGSFIFGSTIAHNTASSSGGGIASTGSAESVTDSSITDDIVTHAASANSGGGGLYESGGGELENDTVAGNTAATSGAGPAGGGGIFADATLTTYGVTISGNAVTGTAPGGGGGIFGAADVVMTDSTVDDNSATKNGGGIGVAGGSAFLTNATVFKNVATGLGGNFYNDGPSSALTNSIFASGTAATGPDIDNAGTLTSNDYNIVQTAVAGAAMTGTTAHNKTANPELLALAGNGGPTFTNADQATSPGRAYIPFAGGMCGSAPLPQDQRGFTRGTGGKCDVGAYEYAGVATAIRYRPLPKLRAARHAAAALPREFPRIDPRRLTAMHLQPRFKY